MNQIFDHPAAFELLERYRSPPNETSVAKGIPVTKENLAIIAFCNSNVMPLKIRYRGPRRNGNQGHCLKGDAKSFAVYRI